MYHIYLIGALWYAKNAKFSKTKLNNVIVIKNMSKCVKGVVTGEVRVHIVQENNLAKPRNAYVA